MVTSATPREQQALAAEADVAELASVWALLNVLDQGDGEHDHELREMRAGFDRQLLEFGCTQGELFEFVRTSIEFDDWDCLGVDKPEP